MAPTKITTLLFDCDNTLVMSEPLAFEACATLANEILESRNIPDRYTGPQLLEEFVGMNFRGMITKLIEKYKFEMDETELKGHVAKELAAVIKRLYGNNDPEKGDILDPVQPCVGVDDELEKLAKSGKYLMSVVSSSAKDRVVASVEIVGQDKYFKNEHIFSAASSLDPPRSKPNPRIYEYSREVLGEFLGGKGHVLSPLECVAIEDSKSGATAACSDGLHTIGYTGSYPAEEVEKMTTVLRDVGCKIIMNHWSEFPACLAKIENGEV